MPPLLKATDLHPFNRFDVPSLLAMRATHRRDHPFIIWAPFDGPPQRWTYSQFHHQVGRIAGGLAQRGVVAGERRRQNRNRREQKWKDRKQSEERHRRRFERTAVFAPAHRQTPAEKYRPAQTRRKSTRRFQNRWKFFRRV